MSNLKKVLGWVYHQLKQPWAELQFFQRRRELRRQVSSESQAHREYLDVQLRRTHSKKDNPLPMRARRLIDRTSELIDLTRCEVLCIGSRNVSEIEYFRSKGAERVIGIDLFSDDEAILVMDMHRMDFSDDRFDVVYSAHSLEHAHDVRKVIGEIVRVARPGALVAIEVPIRYETRGADMVDFGSSAGLHAAFEPHIAQVLWCEEHEPSTPMNEEGTAIVRTVFSLVGGEDMQGGERC